MSVFGERSYAFNRTRQASLADDLRIAETHWTRLRGLIGTSSAEFGHGKGLWIIPCRGVHTLGMTFPIDVIYLSTENTVVHLEKSLRPWRFGAIRAAAKTVLEVPAATIEATGTALGDSIEIRQGNSQKESRHQPFSR